MTSAKVVDVSYLSGWKHRFTFLFFRKGTRSTYSSLDRSQANSPIDLRVFIVGKLAGYMCRQNKKSNFKGKNDVGLAGVFFTS